MTVYAVFTRARFVGLFSQIYLLMSCWVMVELCARSDNEYATLALIPIATMYLMNIGIPVAIARIGRVPEMIHSWVAWIQLVYRISPPRWACCGLAISFLMSGGCWCSSRWARCFSPCNS